MPGVTGNHKIGIRCNSRVGFGSARARSNSHTKRPQRLRRCQSSSPPLYRRRGHGCCSRAVRHGWFCGRSNRRDKTKSARNQAGDEHHVRALEADRRRSPERRIRRGRPRRRPLSFFRCTAGPIHLQLCRCRPSAGGASCQAARCAMASNQRSRSTPSPRWTRSKSTNVGKGDLRMRPLAGAAPRDLATRGRRPAKPKGFAERDGLS